MGDRVAPSRPCRRAAAVALAAAACFSPGAREVEVRPVRVRVVDAATKQPLEGVPVVYALQAMVMRDRILGIVPVPLEPDIGPRLVHKERGATDASGDVVLTGGKVPLRGNERLYESFLLVNLGVDLKDRIAQLALDAELSGCRRAATTCPPTPPDDVDVALKMIQWFEDDRVRVFRNAAPAHRGEVVITVPGAKNREWYRDWSTPRDRFRVRFEFERLAGRSAPLVVELDRPAQ